jgi:hypothetical protein
MKMAEKTYEEWLAAFRDRIPHSHLSEQQINFLLFGNNPEQDYVELEDVPEKYKTAELCLLALKTNGHELLYVPEKLKTAELCLTAIMLDGCALQYVPEKLRTVELCLAAVKKSGYSLEYVPENFKTAELCLTAVKENFWAIVHVPEKLKTAELCLAAIEGIEAIKADTNDLDIVPDDHMIAELYLKAGKTQRKLKDGKKNL